MLASVSAAVTVTLNSPIDGFNITTASPVTDFQFTPVNDTAEIQNCSLFTNESGSMVFAAANESEITVNVLNSITYGFSNTTGYYLWSIGCYEAGSLFMAAENRKLTLDNEPPVTSAVANSTSGAYVYGDWTDDGIVTNTLTCTDGGSGCASTLYCLDTSDSCVPSVAYVAPVDVSTEGVSYIRFASVDAVGNQEVTESRAIKINTLPVVESVTIIPAVAYTADDLECWATVTDADHSEQALTVDWVLYEGGSSVDSGTLSIPHGVNTLITTYLSPNTMKGDVFTCKVTPHDGYEFGEPLNSSSVTILNTAPTLPDTLTPETGIFGGDFNPIPILCGGSTDADSDTIFYNMEAYYYNGVSLDWHALTAPVSSGIYYWYVQSLTSQTGVDLRCSATDEEAVSGNFNPVGTLSIDNEPPVTSDDADSAWVSSDVTVTLSCSDGAGVGCDQVTYCVGAVDCAPSLTADISSGSFGVPVTCAAGSVCQQYVRYFSNDSLNNTESVKTSNVVRIDNEDPVTSADAGVYVYGDWTDDGTVTNTLTCTDGGSGCAPTLYCLDTSDSCVPSVAYVAPVDVSTEGVSYIRFYSVDEAGNEETPQTETIKIDTTPPTVGTPEIYAGTYYVGANTYFKGTVSIQSAVSDWAGGSGLDTTSCEYSVDFGSGETFSATYSSGYCQLIDYTPGADFYILFMIWDIVGHESESGFSNFIYDATGPTEPTLNAPGDGDWLNTDTATLEWAYNSGDAGSGVSHYEVQIDSGDWATQTSPYETPVLSEGAHEWCVRAVDNLGNEGGSSCRTVNIDLTAPVTEAVGFEPSTGFPYSYTFDFWTNKEDIGVGLLCTDVAGSGCFETYYCVGDIACEPTTVFTSQVVVSDEGWQYIRFYSKDNAGNVESPVQTKDIKIDRTAPETTDDAPFGWQTASFTVTLECTDAVSGCAGTFHMINGGDSVPGSSVLINTDGEFTITYYSIDNAGNVEDVNSVTVYLDTTDPLTTATAESDGENYNFGDWAERDTSVLVTLTCEDFVSGCVEIYYCNDTANICNPTTVYTGPFVIRTEWLSYIRFQSEDYAGNREAVQSRAIRIVGTPEEIVWVHASYTNNGTHFSTIMEAIQYVAIEGTVNVAPGTYNEDVFIGKPLTLTSTGDATDTTISGVAEEYAIVVGSPNVEINGFKVIGPNNGIYVGPEWVDGAPSGSGPTSVSIIENVFDETETGISLFNSQVELTGNTVTGNVQGMLSYNTALVEAENTFMGNGIDYVKAEAPNFFTEVQFGDDSTSEFAALNGVHLIIRKQMNFGEDRWSATQVEFLTEWILDLGGVGQVFIPAGTIITGQLSFEIFDVQIAEITESLVNIGGNVGKIQFGVPDLGLTFSKPITVSVYIGEGFEGTELSIFRSINGETWTQTGLNNVTCTVDAGGICEFQTSSASYFAASENSAQNMLCGANIVSDITLTNNIACEGSALYVSASGVTINCNGRSITGDGSGTGIFIGTRDGDLTNITVKNCKISNFSTGIEAGAVLGLTITNNEIFENGLSTPEPTGLSLSSITGATITNNNIHSNDVGVYLLNSNGIQFENNILTNNLGEGLDISNSEVFVVNGKFENNGGHGIKNAPPASANWIITSAATCKNNDVIINGDLTFDGGELTLENCLMTIAGKEVSMTGTITSLEVFTETVPEEQGWDFTDSDSSITVNLDASTFVTIAVASKDPESAPSGLTSVKGIVVSVNPEVYDSSDGSGSLQWAFIKIFYDDLPAGMTADSLKIYYFNKTSGLWLLEPNQGVNETGKYVWANITHFSSFGLFGTVTSVSGGVSGGSMTSTWTMESSFRKAMRVSETVKFAFKGETHLAKITEVGQNFVRLLVASSPQSVTVNTGQFTLVDVDQDGTMDLKISLEKVESNLAYLTFEKYYEQPVDELPEEDPYDEPPEQPPLAEEEEQAEEEKEIVSTGFNFIQIALIVLVVLAIASALIILKGKK